MWKNVENKKSLSLHNSQLSRDSPTHHLVPKKDIQLDRYRETFPIPIMGLIEI